MTREEAMEELAWPLYDPEEREADITYFCKNFVSRGRSMKGLLPVQRLVISITLIGRAIQITQEGAVLGGTLTWETY